MMLCKKIKDIRLLKGGKFLSVVEKTLQYFT